MKPSLPIHLDRSNCSQTRKIGRQIPELRNFASLEKSEPFMASCQPRPNQGLRIAYFVDGTSAKSGVDTSSLLLARGLRRYGHQVTFFVPQCKDCDDGRLEPVVRLPAMRMHKAPTVYWCYPISMKLMADFRRQPFDLIHIHNATTANFLVWQLSTCFHVPVVYTYHTMMIEYTHYLGAFAKRMAPLMRGVVGAFDRQMCRMADWVTTPSYKAKDYLDKLGMTRPVEVIPNGIDPAQFAPRPSRYLVDRLGLPAESRVVLFVGRLSEEKSPLDVYHAFRSLYQRADAADAVELVMAGEGPLREEIAQRARSDGLAQRVHLLGQVPYGDMPALYNAAHIWLSASTTEVLPMVALESAACGLPAVVRQDRALDGVVVPNTTGFVAQTVGQMADSLYRLLHDAALHERMAAAAWRQSRQFDLDVVSQRFAALYRRLAKRGAKG
jgi:glycosyltransferase involved in cell wall biosynthesis